MSAFDVALKNTRDKSNETLTINVLHDTSTTAVSKLLAALDSTFADMKRSKRFEYDVSSKKTQIEKYLTDCDSILEKELKQNPTDRTNLRLQSDLASFKRKYEDWNHSSKSSSYTVTIPEDNYENETGAPQSFVVKEGNRELKFKTLGAGLVEDAILDERTEEAENIVKKTGELNALFQDVNKLVEKQGEEIQEVAANTEHAQNATQKGLEHVTRAEQLQKSGGRCFMYLAIFLVLVSKNSVLS